MGVGCGEVLPHATGDGPRGRLGLLDACHDDGLPRADRATPIAVRAGTLVDDMHELGLAHDGVVLAGVKALPAAVTARDEDVVGHEGPALPCRTLPLADMRLDLVAKEVERLSDIGGAFVKGKLLSSSGRRVPLEGQKSFEPTP